MIFVPSRDTVARRDDANRCLSAPANSCRVLSPELSRNSPKRSAQVRRTPRRQTGLYKTNRECRWKLNPDHPEYTTIEEVPRIEAKLFAMALEFDAAPHLPDDVRIAAEAVLQKSLTRMGTAAQLLAEK